MAIDGPAALIVAVLLLHLVVAQDAPKPVIVVYSGTDTAIARALASLIEQDARFSGETLVVSSPSAVALATLLPTTQCIVVYSDHRDHLVGFETTLLPFFSLGGGLVGIRDTCYEPSAGNLSKNVFPVYGNFSLVKTSMVQKRVRTYVGVGTSEVTAGLPETFQLVSMGTFLCADKNGTYIPIPGSYRVLYEDEETGSPLVLTYESEGAGRSVALPGMMVVKTPRVDVYYGTLLADENFVKLFTNSVFWAAASPRFASVTQDLEGKLATIQEERQAVKEQAELAQKRDRQKRLATVVMIWALGLVACALITKKLILGPVRTEAAATRP